MILSKAVLATLFASVPSLVDGHGYVEKPMCRNLYANTPNGTDGPAVAGKPWRDWNPSSLNANTDICGKTQNFTVGGNPENSPIDYSEWTDSTGEPMPWIVQETYSKGQVIDVAIKLTAEHCGFFEMKGCPMGRDSSQDCFDNYRLEFIEDITPDWQRMPKDLNYPYRAYFKTGAVGQNLLYRFKLPDDLVGDQVLLQWVYWTGNSCWLEGYDEYINSLTIPNIDTTKYCLSAGKCPIRKNIAWIRDPNWADAKNPELFWSCSEVAIYGEPTPTPPFEPPTPHVTPVAKPVGEPSSSMMIDTSFITVASGPPGQINADPTTPAPTCPPCEDNDEFKFIFVNRKDPLKKKYKGGCDHVAKKPKKRCRKMMDGKKIKFECPVTCNACPC